MALENYTTNVDNIRQDSPEWVKEKISSELASLKKEVFYNEPDKDWNVVCDMDTVKSYLESIKDLKRGEMQEKWAALVMAVQIALESKGYDVWKIDWVLWPKTKEAVRKFQTDVGGIRIDWVPWPETVWKILESLGNGDKKEWDEGDKKEWDEGDKKEWDEGDKKEWDEGDKKEWDEGDKKEEVEENPDKFNKKVFKLLKKEFTSVVHELGLTTYDYNSNPTMWVNLKLKENYWFYWYKIVMINLHNFVDENWVFDREWLKRKITELNDQYNVEMESEHEKNVEEQEFINVLRRGRYSFEDLFWNQEKSVYYDAFFNEFNNKSITLKQAIFHDWDKFSIWMNGSGYKSWRYQSIDKSSLRWVDWKYSEDKFKEILKNIVVDIVDKNYKS